MYIIWLPRNILARLPPLNYIRPVFFETRLQRLFMRSSTSSSILTLGTLFAGLKSDPPTPYPVSDIYHLLAILEPGLNGFPMLRVFTIAFYIRSGAFYSVPLSPQTLTLPPHSP